MNATPSVMDVLSYASVRHHSKAITRRIARDEGRSSGFFSKHLPMKSLNSLPKRRIRGGGEEGQKLGYSARNV